MDGPVTWPQLYFIGGISATAIGICCWLVYRVCERVAIIETRLTKLEK